MLTLLYGITGQVQLLSLTAMRKGHPLKMSHIRKDDAMFIKLSVSLLKHSSLARNTRFCQQIAINRG